MDKICLLVEIKNTFHQRQRLAAPKVFEDKKIHSLENNLVMCQWRAMMLEE